MKRILVYFLLIVLIAAGYLVFRGFDGITVRNVAVTIPCALLFAALVWLRWDIAPAIGRRKRARASAQPSESDAG